jgi:hypothetical protein
MRKPDEPAASTETDGEARSFYGRWSRRKRLARDRGDADDAAAREGGGAGDRPAMSPAPPAPGADGDAGPGAPKVLTDEDMPPLDSLGEDDDYSGFMSPGVSEALRTRALRKLFTSGKFNVVDGLNDYDDDFTSFEPLGDVITSDMRHRAEMEARRAAQRAGEEIREAVAGDGSAGDGLPSPGDPGDGEAHALAGPADAGAQRTEDPASGDADDGDDQGDMGRPA